ncbi:MAG TPA: class II aldolase/adducin family protein [Mycobacteriales bacterium]|nr:class II aldolase/adducin family protein [Mycobacteriales bacterium]
MTVDLAAPPYAGLIAELAHVGRQVVGAGLVIGSGGNLSARPPGGEVAVVTGTGTWLDRLTPADFSLVRIVDGAVVGGSPTPSVEVALHTESYRVRPDINAVIHLHPQMSVLLPALGHQIRLITTDHVYYVREIRVAPYRHSGTPELAQAATGLIADGTCNCVVLSHHGCSVVAPTIELAHKRAANLEEAARATFHALQLGDTRTVCPPEYRDRLARLAAADPDPAGTGRH